MLTEFSSSGNNLCFYVSQTDDPVSGGFRFNSEFGANTLSTALTGFTVGLSAFFLTLWARPRRLEEGLLLYFATRESSSG